MKVQKPELNQGESLSVSNVWSQGDKTLTNTCTANRQLQSAKFLVIHMWLVLYIWGWLSASFSLLWSISFIHLSVPCLYKCNPFLYIWGQFIQLMLIFIHLCEVLYIICENLYIWGSSRQLSVNFLVGNRWFLNFHAMRNKISTISKRDKFSWISRI